MTTLEEMFGNPDGTTPVDDTIKDPITPNEPLNTTIDETTAIDLSKLFEVSSEEVPVDPNLDPLSNIDGKPVDTKPTMDLTGIVSDFKELGVIDDDILKEYLPEGTALTQDILSKVIKEQPNRIANKILKEADDKSEGLIGYIADGGNISEWVNTYLESRTLIEPHDIEENDASAEAVNRAVYKSMGLSDEAINNKIARLSSLGILKDEASENYDVYANLKKDAISNLNTRQAQNSQVAAMEAEKVHSFIKQQITDLKDLNGIVFDKKSKQALENDIFSTGRLNQRLNGAESTKLYFNIAVLEQLGILDFDFSKFSIVPTNKGTATTNSGSIDFTKRFKR